MEDANLHFCKLKGCTSVHFVRKEHVMCKESYDERANITVNKAEALQGKFWSCGIGIGF